MNKKLILPIVFVMLIVGVGAAAIKNDKTVDSSNSALNTSSTVEVSPIESTEQDTVITTPKVTSTKDATPKTCTSTLTKSETEGPYYTAGSPAKTDFSLDDPNGEIITISGYVFDASCNPIPNAYLDLWHANSAGAYDNVGYTLRGHFSADANGYYSVKTIIAGKYPGRTEHWHIKIARDSSLADALTTQLFPPGGQSQEGDSIFDASLLVNDFVQTADDTRTAHFNFVIQ